LVDRIAPSGCPPSVRLGALPRARFRGRCIVRSRAARTVAPSPMPLATCKTCCLQPG
jgi:hypothetical protein